jgi:hypothetical protein
MWRNFWRNLLRKDQADEQLFYAICDIGGDELDNGLSTLGHAIEAAVAMLDDDPEQGELTVWSIHPSGNLIEHLRTVTFGPDANWDTVIVVLKPGEHVRAPGPVPRRIREEDLDGYELDDPKRIALEQRLGEWY